MANFLADDERSIDLEKEPRIFFVHEKWAKKELADFHGKAAPSNPNKYLMTVQKL